jgi:hypothetical protein
MKPRMIDLSQPRPTVLEDEDKPVMRVTFAALCAVVIGSAGCSAAPGSEAQPRPEEASPVAAPTPELSAMIVLRPSRGLEFGDTVTVDLANIDDDGRVPRYARGKPAGSVSLNDLGPAGTGRMVVTASKLNVRRCRSTGCSVLGYLVRDQEVEASDFAGRWYRVRIDAETSGYALAEYLQPVLARQRSAIAEIRRRTAAYYRNELEPIELDRAPLFTEYRVALEDELLTFIFNVRRAGDEALPLICNAMRGIADFVRDNMASYPPDLFPAYSAGVYLDSPGAVDGEDMLAGLTGDGGVYCRPVQ